MNNVVLMGRFTKNPDIRYSQAQQTTCIARFNLAVDRRFKREGAKDTDFISCVAFGHTAEFIEKYMCKGIKVCVNGRIQTDSYQCQDGSTAYTTDVVVENIEFCESKSVGNTLYTQQQGTQNNYTAPAHNDGFVNVADGIDEELPFN